MQHMQPHSPTPAAFRSRFANEAAFHLDHGSSDRLADKSTSPTIIPSTSDRPPVPNRSSKNQAVLAYAKAVRQHVDEPEVRHHDVAYSVEYGVG